MAAASNSTNPGAGDDGKHLEVVDVVDGPVRVDHAGAHARGPHVDHEDLAHGHRTSPNGEGSPSFPGLRMPRGSRVSLRLDEDVEGAARGRRPGSAPG